MTHITLLAITDGRQGCFERTMDSLASMVGLSTFDHRIVVNDSTQVEYGMWIEQHYRFDQHYVSGRRLGFGGAIQMGWTLLPPETDYVFHLEDDFTFNRPLDVRAMAAVLAENPRLVQLALRRQPWNDLEIAAGGIVECHPFEYCETSDGENVWLEHRLFFTTNPSLYRRDLTGLGWPSGSGSESAFTQRVLADRFSHFGYWGPREDPPWVHHIGDQRAGVGY